MLVILVGAYRVNAGLCGPGAITAFLTYFTIILNAMMSITRVLTMWSKALASADRIEEVLATGDELTVQPCAPKQEEAHVVFDKVSFSYNGKENILASAAEEAPPWLTMMTLSSFLRRTR